MNLLESLQVAISAIWVNKMRSLLTMLGIIIGIASVITVVALGDGSQKAIDQEFERIGSGRAVIYTNWRETPTVRDRLTHGDLEAIQRVFKDDIDVILPDIAENGKIKAKNNVIQIDIQGANENYHYMEKTNMIKGRYLIEDDVKSKRSVGLIDEKTAIDVFGRTNVLGESMIVDIGGYSNVSITVVGLYEKPKSSLQSLTGQQRSKIFIPYTTLEKTMGMGDRLWMGAELNIHKGVNAKELTPKIIKLIERRHANVGQDKYKMYTAEGEMETITQVTTIITAVIGAIAGISLLVGGIGVMNIMLVSVTERTREIGIRKAIGAKRKDILLQFLVESIIVSGIGGIIGTVIGIGISFCISAVIKIPPSVSLGSISIAWAFSAGVGIFFGMYPANKASKLDPIVALRYE